MKSRVRKPTSCLLAGPLSLIAAAVLVAVAPLRAGGPPHKEKETGEVRQLKHGSYIYEVAFSPDGKLVATDDQVWEVATGKRVATLPLPPLADRPFRRFFLAFSPDSRHIAVHRYYDIVLAEAATGKQVWKVGLRERGDTRECVPRLAFTPDGKQLLSARNDEALVRVWAAATGKEIRSFPFDTDIGGQNGADIRSFGVSADGKRVVVHSSRAGHLGGPVVLEYRTGKELHRYRVSSEEAWVHFSAPSPSGSHLAYSRNNAVHLLDLETGKEVRKLKSVGQYAFFVAYSPDGKYVAATVRAAGREEDWIECWEVATGKSTRVIKGHTRLGSLTFSPDGKHILSSCEDNTARLWRLTK